MKRYENLQSRLLLHVMKSTKSGTQQQRWPEGTFSPVRASTGQWVLKNGGPLSYLEGFCVTQKNWQDFGEWRLERRKKLDVKTHPILSQVR